MLLAYDDTDSPEGGCTTHTLFHVLANLPGLAPRGMPRLVRLNPNVPWKTRGNGAVVVELVEPQGPHVVVGEWMGMELRAYPEGRPVAASDEVLDAAWHAIERVRQPDASPAVALFDDPPSPLHYWSAVRTFVDPGESRQVLDAQGARHRFDGDGRALIGCLGAAAWPGPASSYEFIAYREPAARGTPRTVVPEPLRGLDKTGCTFHTEDPDNDVLCCVPNTPCPVLLGLRGTDPERLLQTARSTVPLAAGEPLEGWILWATNQASGDHVTPLEQLDEAHDVMTVSVPATVQKPPMSKEGGHVHVSLADATGRAFTAVAFEPTKGFRDNVRALLPGDELVVTGAWQDGTLRLESLEVQTTVREKTANPVCCDRPMKSRGAGAGYRCSTCGSSVEADAATFRDRSDVVGVYEVPIMARRHLHRPRTWAPT